MILRKTRTDIKESLPPSEVEKDGKTKPVALTGYLKRATSPNSGSFGTVGLDSRELGKRVSVKVPIGMMKDTVQPYFEEVVIIYGYEKDEIYYLDDIARLPDDL